MNPLSSFSFRQSPNLNLASNSLGARLQQPEEHVEKVTAEILYARDQDQDDIMEAYGYKTVPKDDLGRPECGPIDLKDLLEPDGSYLWPDRGESLNDRPLINDFKAKDAKIIPEEVWLLLK